MPSSVIMFTFLALTVLTAVMVGTSEAVSCMDNKNKPVDWFIVYKLPQDSASSKPVIREGYGQMYMDVNNQALKFSSTSLKDDDHAIAYTVDDIYKNHGKGNLAHVMYNDQPPAGEEIQSGLVGHTKGVLAFDGTSGFWLVHSVPKFPLPASRSYDWPDNAKRNGQTLLCITFKYDQFEKIGQQLKYNYPGVYDSDFPSRLVGQTPSIVDLVNNIHVTSPPWNRQLNLQSRSGQSFDSFNKASKWGADLYKDWLATHFKSGLYCETWQNGERNLNSSCEGGLNVYNVMKVSLSGGSDFKGTKDHSKWAVTTKPGQKWTCIGGINRQTSQMYRGGGAVCLENANVHKAFYDSVAEYEPCT
ncbi:plancitoxin-1 isoform X1 [Acanthaster planci]|uniref:Plancitoxin-1 isoform X1 n=1 Tax=Acanthaster planci TaxID=133434 RepID=A0A8B7XYF2_ACAPL|nr:plancitoxin-1 isoform X1 [Acanthaster planci]XP_022085061.1 plancitoxin-1 isoform X1 [Acanthaster planci]